jgi:hypothetical protein
MDGYAPDHKYVGTGTAGLEEIEKVRRCEENVSRILERWPGLVRRNTRRAGTLPEILLNTKRRGG